MADSRSITLPTSSDDSIYSDPDEGSEDRGFPLLCPCGGTMLLSIETTPANRGRLYYRCFNLEKDGGPHNRKWRDEAMREEIESLRQQVVFHDYRLARLNERLNNSTEPFSPKFAREVTKLNILIQDLQRRYEDLDTRYYDFFNMQARTTYRFWRNFVMTIGNQTKYVAVIVIGFLLGYVFRFISDRFL